MPQTLVEKIAQKYAHNLEINHIVHSGDFIYIQPAYVMTHDNTGAVIPKFLSIGAKKIANPSQVVYALDHNVQDTSEKNLLKYKKIENFSKEMGTDFYPAGRGIGHQIMCEEGYAFPGTMMVASDSHSNMYGGLGCLGTPIVRTDAAAIWATGKTWWQVPQVIKVILNGKLPEGVYGKDIIIALCGHLNNDEVLNHAIEFSGDGVKSLSIDERLSIANMTTEWGALAGVFPIDEAAINWLKVRNKFFKLRGLQGVNSDVNANGVHPRINDSSISNLENNIPQADEDAFYAKEITLDLNTISPYVSGPNTVKIMNSAKALDSKNIKINKAYLVSCVNSRLSDLQEASKILKDKKIDPDVQFYVAAASSEVQAHSEEEGYWKVLMDAGAIPLPPGCGPCIGLGKGLLQDGEVGISATNRNFKGRMGSPSAQAYLASPAVVAFSALKGKISYFINDDREINLSVKTNVKEIKEKPVVKIIDGFPKSIIGNVIFCHQNNLNTDGIYPGKYTYNDDFTPQQQASVVMENYDVEFKEIVKEGDILAGGYNFGTGSSREQAATALKYKGIKLVIAASFNETYKRNAINNGYLIIECSKFIDDLACDYGREKLTINTKKDIEINFEKSIVTFNNKTYSISPVGEAAQVLIVCGGLENWVKENL